MCSEPRSEQLYLQARRFISFKIARWAHIWAERRRAAKQFEFVFTLRQERIVLRRQGFRSVKCSERKKQRRETVCARRSSTFRSVLVRIREDTFRERASSRARARERERERERAFRVGLEERAEKAGATGRHRHGGRTAGVWPGTCILWAGGHGVA